MSLKNNVFRFAACTAATLLLGALAVPAMAAEGDTSFPISKTVTAATTTYMPNTSFGFTLASGEAGTLDGQPVLAGPADGLLFGTTAQGSLSFTPDDGFGTKTKTLPVDIDITKFATVGIYHYTVTEADGGYEGIAYDTPVHDLYVYITNGAENIPVFNSAFLYLNGEKVDAFVNDYGLHNNTLHNLTVSKTVTGNQGDHTKDFHFTLGMAGADGEKYMVETGAGATTSVLSGGSVNLTLKSGESFTVYGLSASDTYTVTETDANTDGYITTFDGVATETGTVTGQLNNAQDKTIDCENNRNVSPITGLHTDALPYAAMLLLAGGCAALLLRKKSK